MLHFRIFVFFYCLFFALVSLYGQVSNQWRQLTTDDGLSSNSINIIYQSKNGDIWIGTGRGTNRYNGVFESFSGITHPVNIIFQSLNGYLFARQDRPEGPIGSGVYANSSLHVFNGSGWENPQPPLLDDVSDNPEFAIASTEQLWVSTRDGLVGFDGRKWQLFDPETTGISWVIKDPDGKLWTQSWRLGILSFDGQKWTPEFDLYNSVFGKVQAFTQTVCYTLTGKILLGTDEGLFEYDPNSRNLIHLLAEKIRIQSILEATNGTIWIIGQNSLDNGLLYSFENGKWTRHLADQSITTIYQSSDDSLWLGTRLGLYLFEQKRWKNKLSLTTKVNCIYQLDDGTMMIGSDSGLWVEPNTENAKLIVERQNLFIKSIFQASNGVVWFRSDQGILSYNGVSWIKHGIYSGNYGVTGLRAGVVEDADGTMWFNGFGPPVASYKDGEWERHYPPSGGWMADVAQTSDGRIWTFGGAGIWSYEKGEEWVEEILSPSWILEFFENPKGKYWVTYGGKISYFDDGRWVLAPSIPLNQEPRFFQDDNGELWAAGNGIYKWQETEKKWVDKTGDQARKQINSMSPPIFQSAKKVSDGTWRLMSNVTPIFAAFDGEKLDIHPSSGQEGIRYRNVHDDGFAEYPAGVFWLATSHGLRRIEGDSWYDLTVSDGLPSNSIWCVISDNRGYLWVGTEKGLVRYQPTINLQPPSVKIQLVDEEELADNKVYLTGRSYVTIDWIGGDLQSPPDRMTYQYNIDGQWSKNIKQDTITIGLQNGEHRFSIRAIDHHFNTSDVDSMTIIVKTEVPYLSIGNPAQGDIISGKFVIKGRVEDDDFSAFQLFISDTDSTAIPILPDDPNLKLPYRLIFAADAKPRTQTLAILNTTDFDDGDYQIWLTAQDQLQHSSFFKVKIRTDNTRPIVGIFSPKENQRVFKNINISANVTDLNLDSFLLEFSTDPAGKSWEQIYLQADLYQKSEDGSLPDPELKTEFINRDWQIPISHGSVRIRLTATDIAGNTNNQTIQIDVPVAIETRKGGTVSSDDYQTELYIPPNTLAQDTIITFNTLDQIQVDLPLSCLSRVYDFAPTTFQFNSSKPATLTLAYEHLIGKQPIIFHRTDGSWKAVGGTPDPQKQIITTSILSLGQYVVAATDPIQPIDSAKLITESLICQPRVFSPKGNSFNTTTTISFILDQPANVDIKIYSVDGQLVSWLAEEKIFGQGKQALSWGGRDNDGQIVATGIYIVAVTVGTQMQSKVVNVWNH